MRTFRRVRGVGPSRRVQGGKHQSQGHELAQPLRTHGSGYHPPSGRPGFFVRPSSSSSSSAASPSSHSSSSLAPSLLLAAVRIEVTQRPAVALRRACDQAVSSAASARRWQGWCLKYPWKLWCHLNEGVEQVLSRRLDQSETPARLTTQPGGGACANYYGRKRRAAESAPQSCRPGGGHAFTCVCVSAA